MFGGLAPRIVRSSLRAYDGKCRKDADDEWRTEGISGRVVVRMSDRFGIWPDY
jgi:hypothetical protein